MTRYVYDFDEPSEGGRDLLGGKGVGLAEMTQLGIPVPAGFTITTDASRAFMASGGEVEGLDEEVAEHIARLEQQTGKRFGDPEDPLLVSVRSGAAVSMPGMMDTILNVGLNDESVEGLARSTGNEEFARDCYRRLIQMFGETVDDIPHESFSVEDSVEQAREIYERETGQGFPQDAREQLRRAITAVFDSWNSSRAQVYRDRYGIPDDLGTAVNVVQMVFGNKGEDSATGVCFTRNPSTGERGVYGEYLINAQGEDVVAGTRTPQPLAELRERMPETYDQLLETMASLEHHYRDMQDIEFTVEQGHLYLLQTRTAKRTAAAAIKCAVDMTAEGLIEREEAVARIDPAELDQLLHPRLDPDAEFEVAAQGLNASPGAACGKIVLDADSAAERGKAGEAVILVRWETTPDDIHGLIQAQGVLTAHGGMTSHAAVVARGMGKPCVAGCDGLDIDTGARTIRLGGHQLDEGDVITIDGGTGRVIVGEVPLVPPAINEDFETILEWADGLRRLRVRANADNADDAAKAREFGAQGIGLCRTEHMFFGEERLPVVQEMILARDEAGRRDALDRLLPFQQSDFEAIFEAMAGLPVTIRLLDPPLHEFLPPLEEARDSRMRQRIKALTESNPMLGTRGCRRRHPVAGDLRDAGAGDRARGEGGAGARRRGAARRDHASARRLPRGAAPAARAHRARDGGRGAGARVPLRDDDRAAARRAPSGRDRRGRRLLLLRHERPHADSARHVAGRRGGEVPHLLPRGRRAPAQPVRGARPGRRRRPDADRGGAGRETKPEIKLGICGEHGGEPSSVEFCHRIGLDYVSCSPYRVPLARLAAAQAALKEAHRAEYVQAGG